MASLDLIRRPLRDLMAGLMQLPVRPSGEPDYDEADPDVLVRLAESAELALRIVHDGFSAIGLLYACAAHRIAEGRIDADHAAALGRFQAELGELLVHLQRLSVACRHHTADYVANGEPHHERH
ncbi:hypothetical protein CY652_23010 [Burkholderia sp. WAC0059]|nr:hypothetical protein CY652_23010 [Burkholderia sp. WAC0059]